MPQALEGTRVLDLSRMLPGPFASMMLGDLGAEVIKIEEPRIGDPTRWSPPKIGTASAAFLQVNRNKKSVALDLKAEEGRDIFLNLAATADVVLEQFRPGVCDRLRIGYGDLQKLNPKLVYCSLSGYGQAGPYRDRGGHDLNYIALSGILGLTTDERGKPVIPGVQIADIAGGMLTAFSILAALMARDRTGAGQYVDVSMFDVMLSMLAVPAAYEFAGSAVGVGEKYGLTGAYPFYNVYETSDRRFMSLGALEPKFWANFCRAVNREDLIARQFDEGELRASLFEEVRAVFKSKTQSEWVELFGRHDACCEPVLSMTEAFDHEHTKARAGVEEIKQTVEGAIKQLGFAYKLTGTPPATRLAPPALGEHTAEILSALGLSEPERERLEQAGITRTAGTAQTTGDDNRGTLRI